MSKSEAITDIAPAIGASQNIKGEFFGLIVNEINAVKDCRVINMVKEPCSISLYIFLKNSGN
jgi:hypothetical protein